MYMKYYFFVQSLLKKKLETFVSIHLFQTSFYLLHNLIYTFNAVHSHTKPSETIPSSVQSADTNHKQILAYGCNRSTITASRSSKDWRTRRSYTRVTNESFKKQKQNRVERKERWKRRAQQLNPLVGKLVPM